MAVINYTVKENTKTGRHSFYAFPVFKGTLSFEDLCEEACDDNTYSVEEMTGCVSKFMKIVQREAARGFRCQLGRNFLTIYPNIQCSVKDELNQDGTVKKVAEAKDVKASNGKSRLGCQVSTKFSAQFATAVSWKKVDKNGNEIEEEEEGDDITQGNENVDPGSGESQGGNTGGGGLPGSGGEG